MPVRTCEVDQLLKPKRGRRAAMDSLQEFTDLKVILSHGLKTNEAVEITLPDKPKNLRQTFKTRVREYLRGLDIKDYEVRSYVFNGKNIVAVVYVPAIVMPKAA